MKNPCAMYVRTENLLFDQNIPNSNPTLMPILQIQIPELSVVIKIYTLSNLKNLEVKFSILKV